MFLVPAAIGREIASWDSREGGCGWVRANRGATPWPERPGFTFPDHRVRLRGNTTVLRDTALSPGPACFDIIVFRHGSRFLECAVDEGSEGAFFGEAKNPGRYFALSVQDECGGHGARRDVVGQGQKDTAV